jgi:hypothetical protein
VRRESHPSAQMLCTNGRTSLHKCTNGMLSHTVLPFREGSTCALVRVQAFHLCSTSPIFEVRLEYLPTSALTSSPAMNISRMTLPN